jgi:hypothetical protein
MPAPDPKHGLTEGGNDIIFCFFGFYTVSYDNDAWYSEHIKDPDRNYGTSWHRFMSVKLIMCFSFLHLHMVPCIIASEDHIMSCKKKVMFSQTD